MLASAAALVLLFALYYVLDELDPRFYPRSERSLLAFGYYLAGDYATAARLIAPTSPIASIPTRRGGGPPSSPVIWPRPVSGFGPDDSARF